MARALGKSCCKVEQVIYYKVDQSLLQTGVGIIRWGNFITKWGYYYRKSQYIFVTPGQMETLFTDRANVGLFRWLKLFQKDTCIHRQKDEIKRADINFYSPKQDAHSRWSIFKNISNQFEYSAFKFFVNFIGRNQPMSLPSISIHTIYDAFALTRYLIFRIAHNI